MRKSGLDEFKEVVADFRSLSSWVIIGTLLLPLADLFLQIGPPWPVGSFVAAFITFLAGIAVLICVFHFWYESEPHKLNRRMLIALAVACLGIIAYLILFNYLTFTIEGVPGRYVAGFDVRSDVEHVITKDHTPDDELIDNGWKPRMVWEGWSITAAGLALLLTWMLGFISIPAFIGMFVIAQRRKTISRPEETIPNEAARRAKKIKILFLSANPAGTPFIHVDKELRAINEKIRASAHRDLIELVSAWAVRPDDLLQELNAHNPHIVHFSGHGSDAQEIILVDDLGEPKYISRDALESLFRSLKGNIQVVFLNACYARPQAEGIVEQIKCAIGMNTEITDEAAIIFAASFYRAIGFGRSVKEAFEQGLTALMLEGIPEETTPELLVQKDADPSKIVLVNPEV